MVCTRRNMFSPSITGDPTQVIILKLDSRSCQLPSHLTSSVPLLSSELAPTSFYWSSSLRQVRAGSLFFCPSDPTGSIVCQWILAQLDMNDQLLQPYSFKVVCVWYVCMYVCGLVCAGVCTAQLVCEDVRSLGGCLCISLLLPLLQNRVSLLVFAGCVQLAAWHLCLTSYHRDAGITNSATLSGF